MLLSLRLPLSPKPGRVLYAGCPRVFIPLRLRPKYIARTE